MKHFLIEMFKADGTVSLMRVMSFICCLAAVSIAIQGLNRPVIDYSGLALLCSTFLGAAFAGKVAQKVVETKK